MWGWIFFFLIVANLIKRVLISHWSTIVGIQWPMKEENKQIGKGLWPFIFTLHIQPASLVFWSGSLEIKEKPYFEPQLLKESTFLYSVLLIISLYNTQSWFRPTARLSKRVRPVDFDTVYTIYLSLSTQSAHSNAFRGTGCTSGSSQ